MREKERMEPVTVTATYSTAQAATAQPVTTPAPTAPEAAPPEAPVEAPPEANREAPAPEMPKTSAGWLMMLLGGASLSGAGMMLRRKI